MPSIGGWLQMCLVGGAWAAHWLLVKVIFSLLGIPSAVPFLEVVAYSGYSFVPICLLAVVGAASGGLIMAVWVLLAVQFSFAQTPRDALEQVVDHWMRWCVRR
jgi:YIF1